MTDKAPKKGKKSSGKDAASPSIAPSTSSTASPIARSAASSTAYSALPPHIDEMRRKVFVDNHSASNVSSPLAPDAFAAYGVDNSLSLEAFKRDFTVDVIEIHKDRIVFDMIGVEAPIANALRRILLAEVPTMAIEKVVIFQNTSIIQDEVLAHRLGLVPIAADPTRFAFLADSDHVPNELNTLLFTLDVHCTRNPNTTDTATPDEKYTHSLVTTADLVWQPQGRQASVYPPPHSIRPYYDDIVLAKLRPGQSIEAELHVEKGTGAQHAKWSPVATASYRLMPEIAIVGEVKGDKARELVKKCPMAVFDIEDVGRDVEEKRKEGEDRAGGRGGGRSGMGGEVRAVVARPRNCTMCRECVRGDDWSERVQLRRVRDHFIFSVETTGAYTPAGVVKEAIKLLKGKAVRIRKEMERREEDDRKAAMDEDEEDLG